MRIEKNKLTVSGYLTIRKTTGWDMIDEAIVEKAIENDLFSVCIYDKNKLIGIGRVVGDGFIYFYVQDIIVLPKYQKRGIGKLIMDNVEDYLNNVTNKNSFIGLMAASGVVNFYKKYDYIVRPENSPGMYKRIKKQ
jgi:ribosomal protein S18 acetylase RimI-like enzyme